MHILWIDDEIEHLKPHLIFLRSKGFTVDTETNGLDALDYLSTTTVDLIFLDENMPGMSGLEFLGKEFGDIPVVMVTKSEEEDIMHTAIGRNIADYLIKPVHPNQILLSIKKILQSSEIKSQQQTIDYQQEFRVLGNEISDAQDAEDWVEIYKSITQWELKFDDMTEHPMKQILASQKKEANQEFFKFIQREYPDWMNGNSQDQPTLSHQAFANHVLPIAASKKTCLIVIDNLRYDQYLLIKPLIKQYFKEHKDEFYFSSLPTTTQYSRNAFFAGKTPLSISKDTPEFWSHDHEEGGKNQHEEALLQQQIDHLKLKKPLHFEKIYQHEYGEKVLQNIRQWKDEDFHCLIYNFVDMMSHATISQSIMKELASSEKAFRELTYSWFQNSSLSKVIEHLARQGYHIVLTTDHGMTSIKTPIKILADKDSSTNPRYKTGRKLKVDSKHVWHVPDPKVLQLPAFSLSSSFAFCGPEAFFVYPNNYSEFVEYYKNSFQHGGISMEEMLCPISYFRP